MYNVEQTSNKAKHNMTIVELGNNSQYVPDKAVIYELDQSEQDGYVKRSTSSLTYDFIPWTREVVVFTDKKNPIVVIGDAQGKQNRMKTV